MRKFKQALKYGSAVVVATAMPAVAFAADIDPQPLVDGISGAKTVIIAVAGAIFTLVGMLVAIRYAKRVAN